jgi:UDP-N-acetylmuramoyl-tripeptide--D-alanyl-D-alanine ligase
MHGQAINVEPSTSFCGAALDSRRVSGGELFFALHGAETDGHRFVAGAIARGAAAAVVERLPDDREHENLPLIHVADAYVALHELTRHVRRDVPRHLVGVTGSAGKTTTKDLLATMLGERYRTAASPGNLNNLFGFPLALLSVPDDSEWMVAEMGMSTPGELAGVSRLGRPEAVVLTNVRPAHLGSFGDVGTIADAKAEIFEGLETDGLIVANADDPEVVRVTLRQQQSGGQRVVWFGLSGDAPSGGKTDLQVLDLECPAGDRPGSRFVLAAGGERVDVTLRLPGRHNVENFLAAATVAHACGVELSQIARAARDAGPAAMRGVVHYVGGDARVFDDCYNSNPDALAKALATAAELPSRRHWAVLGEMLELGPEAPRYHREAGALAAALGFEAIIGVGELARELVAAAEEAGVSVRWAADAAEAADLASAELSAGDLVLVKGSRGVGLEIVVERLVDGS